nr:hypothetical protein B0A51_03872 [Rachicladosporium sp. CCFEE 5018]
MATTQLVMVHGAFHSPAHFEPLTAYLEKHNYKCLPVALPSTHRDKALSPATLDDDIAAIRKVVLAALEHGDVAILAHSFGGMSSMSSFGNLTPGPRKAAGFSTAVTHAILVASFFAPVDAGYTEVIVEGTPSIAVPDGEFMNIGPGRAEHYFYHDLPAADAEKWTRLLKPISMAALMGKATHAGWREVPVSYLFCTEDQALPDFTQRGIIEMARKYGVEMRVEEVMASHSPFLSMPERTGEFVRRSVGESI